METLTTNGITITVEGFYQSGYSKPKDSKFIFAYRINIENNSDDTVQLLRRHWFIFDSSGVKKEVEGEGVIGKQPVLAPGQSHNYISWVPLISEIGKMHGNFLMQRQSDQTQFRVTVPLFTLIVPHKLN